MLQEEFERHHIVLQNHANQLLLSKPADYQSNNDRMWNFNAVAAMMDLWLDVRQQGPVTDAEAAMILMFKHIASIIQMTGKDMGSLNSGYLKEKFSDPRNYLDLMYADYADRLEQYQDIIREEKF